MWQEKDEKLINDLKNGDFSCLNIGEWFNNYNFTYIKSAIIGAKKNNSYMTLYCIYKYASYFMKNPNIKDWDQKVLTEIIIYFGNYPVMIDRMTLEEKQQHLINVLKKECEDVLEQIAAACIDRLRDDYYNYYSIYDELELSENDNIRLFCCANGPISRVNKFKNDKNERIRKVSDIRTKFKERYKIDNKYTYDYNLINYISIAINNGVITLFDHFVKKTEEDRMNASFSSPIFNGTINDSNFDIDVFYTIKDKKVLASYIIDIINSRSINLNSEMLPDYLINKGEEKGKTKIYFDRNFCK